MKAPIVKKKNPLKVIIPVLIIVLAGVAAAAFLILSKVTVTQIKTDDTVELGSTYNGTVADYMTSNKEKALASMTIDTTSVDTSKTGDYKVPITYKDRTYYVNVTVADTTAPVLTAKPVQTYYVSDNVVPSDLADVKEATDYTMFFVHNGNEVDSISFDKAGDTKLEIAARDTAGNESEHLMVPVTVKVKDVTAPVLSGLKDKKVYMNEAAPDFTSGVKATDDIDGDLTSSIQIDSSAVDMKTAGEYKVKYSVSDAAGNVSSDSITVTVVDKEAEEKAAQEAAEKKAAEEAATASANAAAAAAKQAADAAAAAAAQAALGHKFTDKNGNTTTFTAAEWNYFLSYWAFTDNAEEYIYHHTCGELHNLYNQTH